VKARTYLFEAANARHEHVVASTDCGLGLRCHPQVAWAKLKALTDGATLASRA
jgi:5-methyltetrahydropteroyltriglutamate--homocysteine methyltransferase